MLGAAAAPALRVICQPAGAGCLSHSMPTAEPNLTTPAALDHLDLDVVLCPQHVAELQAETGDELPRRNRECNAIISRVPFE